MILFSWSAGPRSLITMFVRIGPGEIALTRIRYGASRTAALKVRFTIAAFAAEYASVPDRADRAAIDAVLMIEPPFGLSFIKRAACRIPYTTPKKLTSKMSCQLVRSVSSSAAPRGAIAALLKTQSSGPNMPEASMAAATAASLRTSHWTNLKRPARRSDAAHAASSSPAATSTSAAMTDALSARNRLVVAAPMPFVPPVTTATLPARRPALLIPNLSATVCTQQYPTAFRTRQEAVSQEHQGNRRRWRTAAKLVEGIRVSQPPSIDRRMSVTYSLGHLQDAEQIGVRVD